MTDEVQRAPRACYVICTDERSGSNLLCHHLESTGVLGRPFEAFKDKVTVAALRRQGPAGLFAHLSRATTPNGVAGFKLFTGHFDLITGTDWLERLPALQFIYLERRDLLGQAISLVKANQTSSFRASSASVAEPWYDAEAITFALRRLTLAQARWRLFFATNGRHPLHLTYEELCRDPAAAVQSVAGLLHIDVSGIVSSATAMRIQRDEVSDEWRARYVREAGSVRRLHPLGLNALRNSAGTAVRRLVGRFPLPRW